MLSKEQIQFLFTFCENHFVKYYDVQVELVDHLANALELEMQKDSKISFEKALEKVHQSFGVMGFAPLVSQKTKIAEKQGRKLLWKLFKGQFKWPKILLFFLITVILFTTFSNNLISTHGVFVTIILAGCYFDLFQTLHIRRVISKSGKKFLLVGISQIVCLAWLPVYLLPRIFDQDFLSNLHSTFGILLLSIFLSLFIVLIVSLSQAIYSIKNALHKTYPEVFSVTQ
jgi:hypothetical protein